MEQPLNPQMHLGLLGHEGTLCCTAISVGRIRREGFLGNM